MWPALLEWLAEMFGATKRGRWLPFLLALAASAAAGLVLAARWGVLRGTIPVVAFLAAGLFASQRVESARRELWRAACLSLQDPRQRPGAGGREGRMSITAAALQGLARAVDAVRRGELLAANELTQIIDRALLRPEEARLFDAVRAMISLEMGDTRRAAQQAVEALPTGSPPLDVTLGRAAVSDAWGSPARLEAIDAAWEAEGIRVDASTALGRLYLLVKVRLRGGVDSVTPDEARAIADEARAIGDDLLAAELDTRARSSTYR